MPLDFFDENSYQAQAAQQVQTEHKSSLSHELIAGAAAWEAQKAYARHCEQNGKPESHQKARELFAAFAAAEADKLIETKGLDFMDREEVKRQARRHAEENISQDNY
ncbi:CipC protein [Rhodotorula sp. JG-1b]|nr:CipC protein [Rhodotorula sp. JG-1b]